MSNRRSIQAHDEGSPESEERSRKLKERRESSVGSDVEGGLNFDTLQGKNAQQAAHGFTEKHEKIVIQNKMDIKHLKQEIEEVRERMNKKLKKMSKQGTLNMNLGSVSYKDFQVTIESLRKQIQAAGQKTSILVEVDKRIAEKIEGMTNQISEKMEKKHGSKIEQMKKTNMFIVEELLNLDN